MTRPDMSGRYPRTDLESELGLNVVHEPSGPPEADIIFVHGLGGSNKTWQSNPSDGLWPSTLLSKDFPQVRIALFSYDGGLPQHSNIADLAHNLSSDLMAIRHETAKCPIVFVAHSLGGLIVKQIIVMSYRSPMFDDIQQHVAGILFFGTPQRGSDLAGWTHVLKTIGVTVLRKSNASIELLLHSTAESLSQMDEDFFMAMRKGRDKKQPTQIISFYETLPTPSVGLVVPASSAVLPGFTQLSLDANHLSMTKFTTFGDPGYIIFSHELSRVLKSSNHGATTEAVSDPSAVLYDIFRSGGLYGQAEDIQRQRLQMIRLNSGEDEERFLWEKKRLADIYFARGLWPLANKTLRETLEGCGPYMNLRISVMNSLALVLLELDQLEEAEYFAKQSQMYTDLLTPGLPADGWIIAADIIAAARFRGGRLSESLERRLELANIKESSESTDLETLQSRSTVNLTRAALAVDVDALQKVRQDEISTLKAFLQSFPGKHPIILRQMNSTAFILLRIYALSHEAQLLSEAIAMAEDATYDLRGTLGPSHPDAMHACLNLAAALAASDRRAEATGVLTWVTKEMKRTLPVLHSLAVASRNLLALLQMDSANDSPLDYLVSWGGSAPWLSNLILSGKAFLQDTEITWTLVKSAIALENRENLYEREEALKNLLAKRERALGIEHPDTVSAMSNLAVVLRLQGKLKDAEYIMQRVVHLRGRLFGDNHPSTLSAESSLAIVLEEQGKLPEAEHIIRKVLQGYRQTLGSDHPDTISASSTLAVILKDKGEVDEAVRLMVELVDKYRRVLGHDHSDTVSAILNLANMLKDGGKAEEAEAILNDVHERQKQTHNRKIQISFSDAR